MLIALRVHKANQAKGESRDARVENYINCCLFPPLKDGHEGSSDSLDSEGEGENVVEINEKDGSVFTRKGIDSFIQFWLTWPGEGHNLVVTCLISRPGGEGTLGAQNQSCSLLSLHE